MNMEEGHVFISYQWDAKSTALELRGRLQAAGYRVWLDTDDMRGSVLDAIAEAVEKSAVVIVCLSQKYKESSNCKAESEYAYRTRKPIVPVRVETGYYADGWLGVLCGSKVVYDCSQSSKLEVNLPRLLRDLGVRGKSPATKPTELPEGMHRKTKIRNGTRKNDRTDSLTKQTQRQDTNQRRKSNVRAKSFKAKHKCRKLNLKSTPKYLQRYRPLRPEQDVCPEA